MTTTLIPHRQRGAPVMERFNVVRFLTRLGPSVDDTPHEHVEERSEYKSEESDAEHSREHGDAHHSAHLGAGAARDDERHNSHNERKRRHENRSKSDTRCLERRSVSIASLSLEIARELHDQNRV